MTVPSLDGEVFVLLDAFVMVIRLLQDYAGSLATLFRATNLENDYHDFHQADPIMGLLHFSCSISFSLLPSRRTPLHFPVDFPLTYCHGADLHRNAGKHLS